MEKDQRKSNKWLVFAVSGMANLIVSFSINSMTLALPLLQKEFGVGQSAVSWLVMVYSLVPCCTLLVLGRSAELFGYKRQFRAGFLFFGAVCLAAPLLSKSLAALIFFRCLQGLGYSIMISITQAVVTRSFPESERGKALGVNSVFVSAGLAAGPTVGGFLLTFFTWRSLFYFNIPFCLLGFWASGRFLPDDERSEDRRGRMDIAGALLFALSAGAIVIGLNLGGNWGFLSAAFLGCMAAGTAGLVLFVWREKTARSPLMNLRLFRSATFSLGNAVCLISYLVQQLVTFLMPFYLIDMLLLHSNTAGLVMLASPVLMMLVSPAGGGLTDRRDSRLPAAIGLVLISTGCLLMILFGGSLTFIVAVFTLMLVGAGNGFSVPAINTAIIGAVPPARVGVASGMLATMRNLGQTLGVLCGSVILMLRQPVYKLGSAQQAYLFAQRDTYFFALFMLAAALIFVFLLPHEKQKPHEDF